MSTIIDTSEGIAMYHYLAQLAACKLHLKGAPYGMKFGRRSPIAHVKRTYGFTGTNASVVKQFDMVLHGHNPVQAMADRMDAVARASAASVPRT